MSSELDDIPAPKVGIVDMYTDGSVICGNPGRGGYAALLLYSDRTGTVHRLTVSGFSALATTNQMELRAVIEGLKALKRKAVVHIYSDSMYVVRGISRRKRSWVALPEKNSLMWKQLYALMEVHSVKAIWVKGHSGNPGNEAADKKACSMSQFVKAMIFATSGRGTDEKWNCD